MTRVEIDLNVRTHGNWTFVGLEDADGPISGGDHVQVFESESGVSGDGVVMSVDHVSRTALIKIDWGGLKVS